MNLVVFALVGAAAMSGFIRIRRARMAAAGVAMLAVTAAGVIGVRAVLHVSIDTSYHAGEMLTRMHAPTGVAPAIVHHRRPAREQAAPASVTLDSLRRRGSLRIGYDPGNVPFSFFNAEQQLVGFDVELSLQLAETLGVKAEFVPVSWPELSDMLASGEIDVMPGVWIRPYWFTSLRLSDPYLTGTVGLVVRDERRAEFASVEALRRRRGQKIGVPLDTRQLAASMTRYFDPGGAEFVAMDSPGPFFEGQRPDLDAFLMPAEGAAAATLLHPEFTVVVPQPDPVHIPYAFGVAPGARDLVDVINAWITSASSQGTLTRAHRYWVLGQGAASARRRWSILRDVLGWQGIERGSVTPER
jgi:ABC-type amino acid transport substrate-binding protein